MDHAFQLAAEKAINEERRIWIAQAQIIRFAYLEKRVALFGEGFPTRYGLEVRSVGANRCRIDWVKFHRRSKAALERMADGCRFSNMRTAVKPTAKDLYTEHCFREAGPEELALITETEEALKPIRARLRALGKVGIVVGNYRKLENRLCKLMG